LKTVRVARVPVTLKPNGKEKREMGRRGQKGRRMQVTGVGEEGRTFFHTTKDDVRFTEKKGGKGRKREVAYRKRGALGRRGERPHP